VKCASCGVDNCYLGFNSVECVNPRCIHFSQKQADLLKAKNTPEITEERAEYYPNIYDYDPTD